ncbi:probable 4-coumarate--CoA ligase 1 [Armigeres subalbatus]|uniref:probable 4-coumarate--CoA ligase 1 n=1 Tax=Armigeres subalbatus TaxID=124917 RepID=UPI002ED3C0E3
MRSPRDLFTFYDPSTKIWRGANTQPLFNPNQSLGALILTTLTRNPAQVVQICADTGVRVTGKEMLLRTIRVAQNLTRMGYVQENIFSMAVRNEENVAPVMFACLALGIPVNTLDASCKRDDLSHMLGTTRSPVVFCDQGTWPEMKAALEMINLQPKVFIFGDKGIEGYSHVDELLVPTGNEDKFVPKHIEDAASRIAVIVCSSGTTGRSKGVCLSHSAIIANVISLLEISSMDNMLSFSSLYWLSGLLFLLAGTAAGATRVITRHVFEPALALEIIEKFRITVAFFPPATALELLKHPRAQQTDFSSMRLLFSGGSAVSAELKYALDKLVPHSSCLVGYGLSELGGAATFSDADTYKGGSTGYLRPLVQAKIVDANGKALNIGQEGEILVKADYQFLRYYGNDEATKEILDEEGWLHSGDIGRIDENGLLYVVDRIKDIIKYGNYQISPSELEGVIQTIPGVLNVCVAGIPVTGNDLPAALIVRNTGKDVETKEIHSLVERSLGTYKQLRGGVYFTKELPMTPSGKVQRRQCRDILIELYNKNNDGSALSKLSVA